MAAAKGRQARKQAGCEPTLEQRFAKALNHPMRTQILTHLNDRPLSPVELVPILDDKLSNISYHCRVLLQNKCIEVVDKEQVRGAVKTRYRATTRMLLDRENWDRLSKETRNGISISAVGEVIDRATKAIEADTFDKRTERSVITLKMDADEQAWLELNEILREAWGRCGEVESRVANRTGEKFRVTVSILSYESPQDNASAPPTGEKGS
jgi:DNA-binding transcriptional ArsR family regulator